MYKVVIARLQSGVLLVNFLVLTACGGNSSNGQALSQPEPFIIQGAGIKGPLAFASVELYEFDTSSTELFKRSSPIAKATTNAYAEFSGLRVPAGVSPPYILVIDGNNAIDLNTGVAPVIKTLVTVITRESLESRRPVYATPYTTLAFNMLVSSNSETSNVPLDTTLAKFNKMISRSIGFGMPEETDLFSTSPIITDNTTTIEQQQIVVQYRAAIEVLSSLLHEMFLPNQAISTDDLLSILASDLYSDGVINDSSDGQTTWGILDMDILGQDPMDLKIANTEYLARDTITLMDEERALVGSNSRTLFLTENLIVNLRPASLDSTVAPPPDSSLSAPMDLANTLLASTLVASGPVVISGESNVVISGKHITNPNGDCITVKNSATNVTIRDSIIGPCDGKGVYVELAGNVTITGNYIHDTELAGVYSWEAHDVTVDANVFEDVKSGYEAWKESGNNFVFTGNYVKNLHAGGYGNGSAMVLLAYVDAEGIRINDNIAVNIFGESEAEDIISIYKSSGTSNDWIQIKNNKIYGGSSNASACGMVLGDQNGAYQIAENNIFFNSGSCGFGVAGGHHITARNNLIYGDGLRSNAGSGLVVWRFDHQGDGTNPGDCYDITVENNEVTWWQGENFGNRGDPRLRNPYYKPNFGADNLTPNCGSVSGWSTNKFDTDGAQPASLDSSIWNTDWYNPEL